MTRHRSPAATATRLALAAALAVPVAAHASGFALREGSADWMANAFAGETAKAYDASTVFANPAGMVRLHANEIDGSINGIFPNLSFSGANFEGPGVETSGTQGKSLIQSAATGAAFAVWDFLPRVKFGISVTSPFGQRIANPADFVGRYQSLVSSITDINVSIAAGIAIDRHFSIGFGPVIDYFHSRLTQAINTGPTAAITGDPVADLHGSDTAAGFNVGGLYQVDDGLRFGLDYHSRITHRIDGTQSIFVPPTLALLSPQTAALLSALNASASTSITLPDNLAGGVYWQATPKLALMSDVQWTDWSLLKTLVVTPENGAPQTIMPENWRNTWFAAVGASYRVLPELLLQTGFAYDQSPVRDADRTTRIPDSDRYDLSAGLTYNISPNADLMLGYVHTFFASAPITSAASATSGEIVGKYAISADSVSLGARLRF